MLNLILITLVNCLVIALAILVHYECLILLSRMLPRIELRARTRVLLGVFGALVAHTIEVWVFAITFFILISISEADWGGLQGNFNGGFIDCVYYSFTCFTTLGFGDIEAVGAIRFLAVVESLTGLVLIGWSASFLYLQMERFWDKGEPGTSRSR